ncbi:hypothetical protein SpiGrapes_2701 [Sphaerochaeta pleomorpha str. Grapes]|uniref:Uncharacterized protein n=2 Tax=Sphaerochaeta TaxID=399320 RepID=G8QVE4_SPHPG|nr:hypothetical protein SpiGrapes_2701 [Sphaerochaeta pleomorpha str. Grapes]
MVALAVMAMLSLSSCVVTEDLHILKDNSYSSAFDFSVEDFFIAVLQDFNDFMPSDSNETIMDGAIADFQKALESGISTSNVSMQKLNDNAYKGTFDFTNIEQLFSDLGAGSNQTILVQQGKTLHFNLSMDNYDQLVPVIPFLSDENFEAFGPTYNQGLSEADYLEMISFMLGEEGPGAISKSVITLRINTPGIITTFSNGKKISDQVFEFSFPLIDFLLLAKPISFSVSWK